jgi:hypothetical protein
MQFIKTTVLFLLIATPLFAQQPPPKKYDPASLTSMQMQITGLSTKLDTALNAFKSINALTQKVNSLTLSMRALEVKVDGLDVTTNNERIRGIEDKIKRDDAERDRRHNEAKAFYSSMAEWLRWIVGGFLASAFALFLVWFEARMRNGKRNDVVDGALKTITSQTNGINERLRADNDRLRAAHGD